MVIPELSPSQVITESSDDVERSVFEEETKHRTFKIIVEETTFFVNPSFLAERSTYFETLLFGDFKEKREGKAELKDVKAKDFEEFLWVMGADSQMKRKVNPLNFSVLASFSQLWDVVLLRAECIEFIDEKYQTSTLLVDVKTALDVCCACETIKVPVATLKIAASKLAQFSISFLVEHEAQYLLSPLTSTAVFLASQEYGASVFINLENIGLINRFCDFVGCKEDCDHEVELYTINCCEEHAEEARKWVEADGDKKMVKLINLNNMQKEREKKEIGSLEDIFFPTE